MSFFSVSGFVVVKGPDFKSAPDLENIIIEIGSAVFRVLCNKLVFIYFFKVIFHIFFFTLNMTKFGQTNARTKVTAFIIICIYILDYRRNVTNIRSKQLIIGRSNFLANYGKTDNNKKCYFRSKQPLKPIYNKI